jgi:CBS domain-containing protein
MGFRNEMAEDCVRSLPLRDAIMIDPETPLSEAVARMRGKSLGCAVVVDPRGAPTAFFTEQSLLRALLQDPVLDQRPVRDFFDPDFLVVCSSDPITRVWDAVQRNGLRFIAVIDDEGRLIGLTGQRGLAEYLADSFPQQVFVQRLGSTPWMQRREGA